MKAQELFKKIGYDIDEISNEEQLIYTKIDKETNIIYDITFYLDNKTFEAISNDRDYANDINSDELKAIYKQFEELDWI